MMKRELVFLESTEIDWKRKVCCNQFIVSLCSGAIMQNKGNTVLLNKTYI